MIINIGIIFTYCCKEPSYEIYEVDGDDKILETIQTFYDDHFFSQISDYQSFIQDITKYENYKNSLKFDKSKENECYEFPKNVTEKMKQIDRFCGTELHFNPSDTTTTGFVKYFSDLENVFLFKCVVC